MYDFLRIIDQPAIELTWRNVKRSMAIAKPIYHLLEGHQINHLDIFAT